MKKLKTGLIVTSTKRNGVEIIRAYTPKEWEFRKTSYKWWRLADTTIKNIING